MADPTKDETKDLDELYMQAKRARKGLEPDWYMNLAFFQGRHWLAFGSTGLYEPTLDSSRITVTENRISGAVRTELAKMTKSRPVFVVTPNTGDEEDANAAQLAERLMRYMWKHLKMHELSLKALQWSRICGAGFLKLYWDSTIGEPQEVLIGPDGKILTEPGGGKPMHGDQQAAQMLSQQLQAKVTSKKIAQGDLRAEVRSPFQMFVDPICDSFPEAEWVIEESVRSKEYVRRRWDVDLKPDTAADPGLVEGRLQGGMKSGGYQGIKVREYWSKPSKKYPDGVRIVWSQGKILDRDDKPFDPMPYVMFTGIPVPGRLWPASIVDLLRGPQVELNKTLSQMAENRNRIGNPTGLASRQSVQDAEKFLESISQPGGWVFYDEGSQHVPQYLQAPELPEYVKELPARTVSAIEDVSGQHEVTNAQVPPGVTAASAITLLQEADDTRLGLAMQDYEEQLGRFGHKVLGLVSRFYTDARTVKIGGDDGAWEIFDFRGAMLRGNTSIDVQAGSSFPQSKAAQQAAITDWMTFFVQSGNPPHDRQLAQFMRDSGMGSQARLLAEYTTTETQVNRENVFLAQGMQLPINDYDDDQGHIDGHVDFQRQPRYATFPPPVKAIIEQHVQAHRDKVASEQQAQMGLQMQMQGQPPPDQQAGQMQMQMDMAGQQQQIAGQAAQQQGQQAQQQQQLAGTAQQQGLNQAQAEQAARHAEEAHQQKLHQAEQVHAAKLAQIQAQAQAQARGAQGGSHR